jgi:hypothetical protein
MIIGRDVKERRPWINVREVDLGCVNPLKVNGGRPVVVVSLLNDRKAAAR